MTNNDHPASGNIASNTAKSCEANEVRWPHQPLYQKPASEFESKDVQLLNSLEEGWFVEFKDRLPDTAKLARSISSFANSHGGLLVIGAREEQKTRRLAQFSPMCAKEAEQCIARTREAVTSHVTPPPFFEAKAVEVNSLGEAEEDRWIVVVSVPKGDRGPYLHSNGCIYVRVGDSAAPQPLADLAQQERMWTESMTRKAKILARVEMLSEQCRQGAPSVHVVVLADDVNPSSEGLIFDVFREIALAQHAGNAGPVFDHVQTLDTSFVARRIENHIEASNLIWDYDKLRKLHFIQIPVATHLWSGNNIENCVEQFGLNTLAQKLSCKNAPQNLMILSLQPTLYFLSIILRKVQLLHERQGFKGELKLNARVVNAKGTVPFLGTPGYFSEVDASSFPYVVRDVGFVRAIDDPATWISLAVQGEESELDRDLQVDIPNAVVVFSSVAQSLGISPYVSVGIRNGDIATADWEPIGAMLWDLLNSSFSFASQINPKASP